MATLNLKAKRDQVECAMETSEPSPAAGSTPIPTGGPTGVVPGAAGALPQTGTRSRPDAGAQPPPNKKLCDGLASTPMEGQEEASEL